MGSDFDRGDRLSRRRFLQAAGAGLAAAATAGVRTPALAASHGGAERRRPTVAVFGGGIAGLTAAHELAERGFDVTIYERRAWGGKARSTEVPGTATGGRRPLPGEHAYRVVFGFYQNLPDTLRRIPFGANRNGVAGNLVDSPQVSLARTDKRNIVVPLGSLDPRPYTPEQVVGLLIGVLIQMEIPPAAAAYFADRLAVFFSSCDERRLGQWEKTSWLEFIGADRFPDDYRKVLGALPQFTQASKPDDTSAKYVAWILQMWIYTLLGFGSSGPAWGVMNLPTNDAWIDPWMAELARLGVSGRLGCAVEALHLDRGRIEGATIQGPSGQETVVADWYVCALPVERAVRLWSRDILAADPRLAAMSHLGTAWMNGIMFYLRERSNLVDGIVACVDSPWAISLIPQAQFWAVDFANTYGDGRVHDKLSVAIAEWTNPGILYGKPASECTPDEIAAETWEQIKAHVNKPDASALTDDMLHSWDIDPGMLRRGDRVVSDDPLILPTKGTEQYRPDVATGIPNLVLCGDYLNGHWEVTMMEAANYNGKRAANAILAAAGSHEPPSTIAEPFRPPEWEALRTVDETRYRLGQPNLFDVPGTAAPILASSRGAGG